MNGKNTGCVRYAYDPDGGRKRQRFYWKLEDSFQEELVKVNIVRYNSSRKCLNASGYFE